MKVINLTPFAFAAKVTSRTPPQPEMCFVVRARLALRHREVLTPVEGEFEGDHRAQGSITAGLVDDDDDDGGGQLIYPGDLADFKMNAEVMLRGICHPPPRRKTMASCEVAFEVGDWSKRLLVHGPRAWSDRGSGAVMSDALAVKSTPVDYAHAFGGAGYEPNPSGKGFTGTELPNIEDPKRPIRSVGDKPLPAGFGALNPEWPQRTALRGKKYGKDYQETRAPFYARDFDWRFFQSAPDDQQLKGYLRGDETFEMHNLHPEHAKLRCTLPGLRVRLFVDRGGDITEPTVHLDTLFVDVVEGFAYLTWRGLCKVAEDDLVDVSRVLIAQEPLGESLDAAHYHAKFESVEEPGGSERADLEQQRREGLEKLDDVQNALGEIGKRGDEKFGEDIGNVLTAAGLPEGDIATIRDGIEQCVAERAEHQPDADPMSAAFARSREGWTIDNPRPCPAPLVVPIEGEPLPIPPDRQRDKIFDQMEQALDQAHDESHAALATAAEHAEGKKIGDPEIVGRLASLKGLLEDPAFAQLRGQPYVEPAPYADLSRQDLREHDFSGRDLSGCNLSAALLGGANLRGAKLRGANLSHAVFYQADLQDADLSNCDLTTTTFSEANLDGCKLHDASLDTVFFDDTSMRGAELRGARGRRLMFQKTDLTGADFNGVSLEECLFDQAKLEDAVFRAATLTACHLMTCTIAAADFTDAILKGTSFHSCRGKAPCFAGARGERIVFLNAEIDNANFGWAVLPNAFFMGASVKRGIFRGTDLREARFYRTVLDRADLTRANLLRADMRKASLHHVVLDKANLFEASLEGAFGADCSFEDANLKRCRLPK